MTPESLKQIKLYSAEEWVMKTERLGIRELKGLRNWIDAVIQQKQNKALADRIVRAEFKRKP